MTQRPTTQTTNVSTSSASSGAHPGIPADLQGKIAKAVKSAGGRPKKAPVSPDMDPMAGLTPAAGPAPGESRESVVNIPAVVDPLQGMTDIKMREEEERLMSQPELAEEDELGDFDDLDGIEEFDVVAAPKNETLTMFENRIMAATVQGVDMIEVEPRVIQVLTRQRKLPAENYIVYRGVILVIAGKMEEVEKKMATTTDQILFPRGYGNAPLPDGVK